MGPFKSKIVLRSAASLQSVHLNSPEAAIVTIGNFRTFFSLVKYKISTKLNEQRLEMNK